MFAVIKTGGKQYLVQVGQKLKVEKLPEKEGQKVVFREVLLTFDEKKNDPTLGTPLVKGAKVEAKLLRHSRSPKVTIIKHKPKKRYLLKRGHKQPFSEVEIVSISA